MNGPAGFNVLLSLLSASDYDALAGRSTVVDLVLGRDLALAGEPITYCWFPLSGLASVIAMDSNGSQAEVGIIGYDGVVNGHVAPWNQQSTMRILVQIAGSALRIEARHLIALASESSDVANLIAAYGHSLAQQAAFSALAFSQYSIEQRLARWALMCGDRVGDDHIDLTHNALSIMLGVRRAGVTVALRQLADMGAIAVRRGGHSIRNRAILVGVAGAGYGPAEFEYKRLVTPSFPAEQSRLREL